MHLRFLLLSILLGMATIARGGERVSFDDGWRFKKDDPPEVKNSLSYQTIKPWLLGNATSGAKPGEGLSIVGNSFDDSSWRTLDLPHDWGIEGPFNIDDDGATAKLSYWGVGWYRKKFDVPASDSEKQIYLDIDGAMSYSTVWLNGQFVGGWPYGYTSYRLDLTPFIKFGQSNQIAIRLENPPLSSRWYPGGGIDRNVWLVKTNRVHIAQNGVTITTPQVSPQSATINFKTEIDGDHTNVKVLTKIYEAGSTDPIATSENDTSVQIANPKLWDIASPNLYTAVTTLERDGKSIDECTTNFGIRTIQFDPDKGFLLNGRHVEIQGVCQHSDYGALGTAFNQRAMERQVELLQQMGVNAIRTSHNPPPPEFLDLCDRKGILVMDEAFDGWAIGKRKNDYSLLWMDWHDKDIAAFVRRDRNHPSVILWSMGNEIVEQKEGLATPIAAELAAVVKKEDPTRFTDVACHQVTAKLNGLDQTVDVFGFNYFLNEYPKLHQLNSKVTVLASETSSCFSSRGEYFFPVDHDKKLGTANFQVSSYDLYAPNWGSPPDDVFAQLEKNPFVAGEFVWTGFDYLGEPTPFNRDSSVLLNFTDAASRAKAEAEIKALGKMKVPSRSSYFGIFDLSGFPKDRFYLYQSHWRPDLPMAHILPHWNWPDRVGQVAPVQVYTSGDEAELFLNGQSLGRKKMKPLTYRLNWDDVKYQPGELKVVAYKDGKQWAESSVKTTGPVSQISMQPDRSAIRADGQDLSFVTVTLADNEKLPVPQANNTIHFDLTGPGHIIATDNGDATDLSPFSTSTRKAFNGQCLVIIRSLRGQAGTITLKAQSDNLPASQITLETK